MPGKLNLYNLGDLGVHLVETPVHSPDGSFTTAQNAAVSRHEGQHGIRTRFGLAKLTASALDGVVLAIANMPFQDPYPPLPATGTRLFANAYVEGPTGSFTSSTNGTTWTSGATSPNTLAAAVFNTSFTQRGGVISSNGELIYLAANGDLRSFDGTNDNIIATGYSYGSFGIQGGPTLYEDVPVWCVYDATSGKLLRQSGSGVEEITTSIGKPAICVATALGRVYVGTDENRIYYWSESDGTVLDVTLSPTGGDVTITDIAHAVGVVYASGCTKIGSTTATTHKVLKRTADATWSDITPTAQGNYGPMAAFDGALYVVRKAHNTFTGCEVRKYDGSSWTTDLDVTSISTGATDAVSLVAWNGALYATVRTATTRDIIRKLSGTWTRVLTESNGGTTSLYTAMGFI